MEQIVLSNLPLVKGFLIELYPLFKDTLENRRDLSALHFVKVLPVLKLVGLLYQFQVGVVLIQVFLNFLLLLAGQRPGSQLDVGGALHWSLVVEGSKLANFRQSQLGVDWLVLNQIFG